MNNINGEGDTAYVFRIIDELIDQQDLGVLGDTGNLIDTMEHSHSNAQQGEIAPAAIGFGHILLGDTEFNLLVLIDNLFSFLTLTLCLR